VYSSIRLGGCIESYWRQRAAGDGMNDVPLLHLLYIPENIRKSGTNKPVGITELELMNTPCTLYTRVDLHDLF